MSVDLLHFRKATFKQIFLGHQGAGVLKFTIYVHLLQNMLYIKYEKNRNGMYQELQNFQLGTYFNTDHFGPTLMTL
jgi:hypothetical protein